MVGRVSLRDTTFHDGSAIFHGGYPLLHNVTVDGGHIGAPRSEQPYFLDNVTVRNSTGSGVGVGGTTLLGPDVVLQDNNYPVAVGGSGGLLPGSHVPKTGNVHNMVRGPTKQGSAISGVWGDVGIPYVIDGFAHGGGWRILPGTTVLFGPGASIECCGGPTARGLPDAPVTLKALDPAQPWKYLKDPGRLEHVVIQGSESGVVYPNLGPVHYVDSTVFRDNQRAIDGPAIVRGSDFFDNEVGAVVAWDGDLNGATNPNAFVGNTLAVQEAEDATHNWWGDPSGPTGPQNPRGTGDQVDGSVPVKPFRTSPPDRADDPPVVRF